MKLEPPYQTCRAAPRTVQNGKFRPGKWHILVPGSTAPPFYGLCSTPVPARITGPKDEIDAELACPQCLVQYTWLITVRRDYDDDPFNTGTSRGQATPGPVGRDAPPEARERGATDPRVDVNALFSDAVKRVRLNTRLGLTEGGLDATDWTAIVDAAYLSL